MATIVMDEDELRRRLQFLAERESFYNNTNYPWNVLYFHGWGSGGFSADCVNLIKSLANGREVENVAVGSYQASLSNTGDVDEYGLISQCSDVSGNFVNINDGHPRVLYMDGHIGCALGNEVTYNGNVYNTVECTAWTGDFGHDGIIYSYCTTGGVRLSNKNGYGGGQWRLCGRPTPWISESSKKQEVSELEMKSGIAAWQTLANADGFDIPHPDGVFGTKSTAAAEYNQSRGHYTKNITMWLQAVVYSDLGLDMSKVNGKFTEYTERRVKIWQKKKGLYADGVWGLKSTKKALGID